MDTNFEMPERVDSLILDQLEDFFENAPIGLQITNVSGEITSSNLAMLNLMGYGDNHTSYEGKSFADYFVDADQYIDLIKAAQKERINNVIVDVRYEDATRSVIIDLNAKTDAQGKIIGYRWFVRPKLANSLPEDKYIGNAPDGITDTENAAIWGAPLTRATDNPLSAKYKTDSEKAARLEELDDFFEAGPAGVHFVGFNGTILRANKAEMEILGYDKQPENYIGQHVRIIHSNTAIVEDLLRRLVSGEAVINFKARLKSNDGTVVPVVIYSGLRLKDGSFENTRCFLFRNHEGDQETQANSFNWPRN